MAERPSDTSSTSSRTSSRTVGSAASTIARAHAKAEAAKVRASYGNQGAQWKIEKAAKEAEFKLAGAKYNAELEALSFRREADAAIAEAESLEAAEALGDLKVLDAISEEEKMECTSKFIKSQKEFHQCESHPVTLVISPPKICDGANQATQQALVMQLS